MLGLIVMLLCTTYNALTAQVNSVVFPTTGLFLRQFNNSDYALMHKLLGSHTTCI